MDGPPPVGGYIGYYRACQWCFQVGSATIRLSQMSFRLREWARWACSMAITWLSALKERVWILYFRARFSTILSGIQLAICARTVIVCFCGFMASPVVACEASIKMSYSAVFQVCRLVMGRLCSEYGDYRSENRRNQPSGRRNTGGKCRNKSQVKAGKMKILVPTGRPTVMKSGLKARH